MTKKYYAVRAVFKVNGHHKIEAYESELGHVRPWDSHYVSYLSDVFICWFDTEQERDAKVDELRSKAIDYGFNKVNEVREKYNQQALTKEEYAEWIRKKSKNGLKVR